MVRRCADVAELRLRPRRVNKFERAPAQRFRRASCLAVGSLQSKVAVQYSMRGDAMGWKTMLTYITGLVDQELLSRNEYLVAENRILRNQIHGQSARAALQSYGKEVVRNVSPGSIPG